MQNHRNPDLEKLKDFTFSRSHRSENAKKKKAQTFTSATRFRPAKRIKTLKSPRTRTETTHRKEFETKLSHLVDSADRLKARNGGRSQNRSSSKRFIIAREKEEGIASPDSSRRRIRRRISSQELIRLMSGATKP